MLEIAALEDHFDQELGPHTRRWGYFQAFARTELLMRLFDHRVPRWERLSFRALVPFVKPLMRRGMKIDPASVERSIIRIQSVFDAVGTLLADGRSFLVGSRPSAADITFASLASPVLGLEEMEIAYPRPDDLPADAAAFMRRLQAHPAGHFARRMYRSHRR
ncbi:MAG: glutathione S-transferase C-terminal domain-containing protein [Polyangiaceae bacterium]|nr:glutathione S-transferase C-terminal domain-containing protein [Polyangiaceae bacterium]